MILWRDESYRIVGACFAVFNEVGCGFLEAVYQECLAMELAHREIPFREHPVLRLHYRGRELKQVYEADFICFDKIIVEIKAVQRLAQEHHAQVINYLKASKYQLGILVNFGSFPDLEYKRFVNQQAGQDSRDPRDS